MSEIVKRERMDVMLDLEALSTKRNGAIIQVAAVPFDITGNQEGKDYVEFDYLITPKSCVEAGLEVDSDTLKWWFAQDENIQDQVIGGAIRNGMSLHYVLIELTSFLKLLETKAEKVFVWGYPATSDLTWIQSCFEAAKLPNPIAYNRTRCLGTMADIYWEKTGKKLSEVVTRKITHNALDDCRMQIEMVRTFYSQLKD